MASDLALPLAQALLTCLCNASGVTNCCLRVGTAVVHDADLNTDLCCEGFAYVRLGTVFASDAFPEEDINRQADSNCPPPSWAVELVAGIVRCVPVGGENGEMPTCADWTSAAVQNFADAQALRAAACCFIQQVRDTNNPQLVGMSALIGRQEQGDPLGGCIERRMTITVQIPNCDCP